MGEPYTYRQIISDYFYGFAGDVSKDSLIWIVYCIAVGLMCAGGMKTDVKNWIMGVPILFAMVSGGFHTVLLPFMMYLIPLSKEERKCYIQKMLYIKIIIPAVFGLLCDIAAIMMDSISIYAFVLQMVSIFIITYICGTLNSGRIESVSVMIYIGGTVMFMICIGSINRVEFWVVFTVIMIIAFSSVGIIRKKWIAIKDGLADYEKVIETEVRQCR